MAKETVLSVVQELRGIFKEIRDILKGKLEMYGPIPKLQPRVINDRFTDNGDGTITDKENKIDIVKDPSKLPGFDKEMTFQEATEACFKLCFAGSNGWRMPTLKEEQSIRDYTRHEPPWNPDIFGGKHDNWYWTKTECSWNKDAVWCVSSYDGGVNDFVEGGRNYVRPVRSCQ